MRRTHWTLALSLTLLALPALAVAQGIGDVSKKEKAKREQGGAPKSRTYTQDDLPGTSSGSSGSAPSTGASTPGAPSASGGTRPGEGGGADSGDARKQEEARWRERAAQADARVERARKRYETFSSMNLVPGYVYQDENGRTVIHSIEELQALTARAKAELAAAEQAKEDLLDQARRESVPPGWLR